MKKLNRKDPSQSSKENVKLSEEESEYATILMRKVVTSLVKEGLLDVNNMDRNNILRETLNLIKDIDIKLVLDYKDTLLKYARKFRINNETKLSYLLYATWFEHWINEIIYILAGRKNLNCNEINEIIRGTSIRGKYTWLLKLFEFEQIKEDHLELIFNLMTLRNSFVHYKWEEENNKQKDKEAIVIEKIEEIIEYLIDIENKHIYNNSKEKLANL